MAQQETVKVAPELHERLRQRETKGETFSEITKRLLDEVRDMETKTEAAQ